LVRLRDPQQALGLAQRSNRCVQLRISSRFRFIPFGDPENQVEHFGLDSHPQERQSPLPILIRRSHAGLRQVPPEILDDSVVWLKII
jgi:hypothetical protein